MKKLLTLALALAILSGCAIGASPKPLPPPQAMQQFLGDSAILSIPMTRSGAAFTPGTDWGLLFTAKRQARDADAQALIQKATGAGITVTGSTAAVELLPPDTRDLAPGEIVWDIQSQNLTSGAVATVASGRLMLVRDVTRLTVTSIPVITTAPPLLMGPPGKSAYQLAVDNGFSGTLQQWFASLTPSSMRRTSAEGAPLASVVISGITGPADVLGVNTSLMAWADGSLGGKRYGSRPEFDNTTPLVTLCDINEVDPANPRWRVILFTDPHPSGIIIADGLGAGQSDPWNATLTTAPGAAAGTLVVTETTPVDAVFVGQTCYVGDAMPFAVWVCFGPALSNWIQVTAPSP